MLNNQYFIGCLVLTLYLNSGWQSGITWPMNMDGVKMMMTWVAQCLWTCMVDPDIVAILGMYVITNQVFFWDRLNS